jgi:hypothetical protein
MFNEESPQTRYIQFSKSYQEARVRIPETAAPHGGLSADGGAQKPVLYAAVQLEFSL